METKEPNKIDELENNKEPVSLDVHDEERLQETTLDENEKPKVRKQKGPNGLLLFIMCILLLMIGCMIVIFVMNSLIE